MARGPKGFSEEDKIELRKKLCVECEKYWASYGYKKTNINELTSMIGISTGAFYLLFSAKEELFFETFVRIQSRLQDKIIEILKADQGKVGFVKALEWHFEEYDSKPFLYNIESTDFLTFLNKLPKEKVEQLKVDSKLSFTNVLEMSELKFKVDKETAHAVITTLLYTVRQPNDLAISKKEIFSFLLNSVIDDIFEER